MKINRDFLKGVAIGLTVVALSPLMAFAARTAIPVITGLFPTALSVNLPAPIISTVSTTTGSVSNGTVYFAVTALDGAGGETYPSNLMGTTTALNGIAWNITWTAVQGAKSYRVYFSTSTPQALVQYFNATTTNAYNFTSTSSPIFAPAGTPGSNTAYTINISSTGNSWMNGGKVGIGTSTPQFLLSVINEPLGTGAIATTTTLFGNQGTSTSRTCFNLVSSTGTAVSVYVGGSGTLVVSFAKCT